MIGPPLAFNEVQDYSDNDPWEASSLPFSSLMPQAQASAWLDALDLIIPVSSILTVVEQIGKVRTEEFDPVVLVVAVLDVAITFSGPLAPPLKVAFKPLAKLMTNPATKKLANIMGPFLGKVAKRVVDSKSIDPLLTLLPFLMIVGEIAADEEAREAIPIIIDAINSSEDLQVWFDYFNLPEDGWEGDIQPELELDLASVSSAALPFSSFISQAYAGPKVPKRLSGKLAAGRIKRALKDLAKGDIDNKRAAIIITDAMGEIVAASITDLDARKIAAATKTLIASGSLLAVRGGIRHVRNLLKGNNGSEPMRVPIFLQMAAIAYMESKIGCEEQGCISSTDEIAIGFRSLYLRAYAPMATGDYKSQDKANGLQYQLTMASLMHLWGETGTSPYGKLIAVEKSQDVFLQSRTGNNPYVDPRTIKPGESGDFSRNIDLVTQIDGQDRPRFIEVKSYQGQTGTTKANLKPISDTVLKGRFGLWNFKTGANAKKPHKQYILDRVLSTNNRLIKDDDARSNLYKTSDIHWLFHKFKLKTKASFTDSQMGIVRDVMAQNVGGAPDKVTASLGYKKYRPKESRKRNVSTSFEPAL